jgi:transcriptional regulator with XRE-family HTH domain
MRAYQTLTGRSISLDNLTPREEQLFLEFLGFAGGPSILQSTSEEVDTAACPKVFEFRAESQAFRAAYRNSLRRTFSETMLRRAEEGPLGVILDDLAQRLERLRAPSKWSDPHNPARFLAWVFRDQCSSLADFSDQTGIEYTHASKILRGTADLSVQRLREVAQRTGYTFEIVRMRNDPVPEVVTCRDYSVAALGQRSQVLVQRLHGTGLQHLIKPILELETSARTGHGGNAHLVAHRRALLLDLNVQARERPEQDSELIVISLGDDIRHESFVWLLLALEYGWFEARGYLVALLNKPLMARPAAAQVRSFPLGAGEDVDFGSWSHLYMDAIHRVLYDLPLGWESSGPPPHDEPFEAVAVRFRALARALFRDPLLSEQVQPVVERWCRALGWTPPSFRQLGAESGEVIITYAVLGGVEAYRPEAIKSPASGIKEGAAPFPRGIKEDTASFPRLIVAKRSDQQGQIRQGRAYKPFVSRTSVFQRVG